MKSELKLLTPKEVAKWLDVSVDWVHNHATRKDPRLPVVRIGKLLRFRNEDVPQSHDQVKTVSPNPAFPNQRAALSRHRKMEHGGHFSNRNSLNKATKLVPKQQTGGGRVTRSQVMVSDGIWRKTVAAGSAETGRFLGLGVRLARDGASGVSLQERFASRRFSR
jgi:Helix-turn-helix domain